MSEFGEINNMDDINCMMGDHEDTLAILEKAHLRLNGESNRKKKEELTMLMNNITITDNNDTKKQKNTNKLPNNDCILDGFGVYNDVQDTSEMDYESESESELDNEAEYKKTIVIKHVNTLIINFSK